MSEAESHARLFASTVPGNGLASTLGLNGAQPGDRQPPNTSREVRDEQHGGSPTPREAGYDQRDHTNPTPEVRHDQSSRCQSSRIQSPPGDNENPNGDVLPGNEERSPKDECIEYMDDVIDTFR